MYLKEFLLSQKFHTKDDSTWIIRNAVQGIGPKDKDIKLGFSINMEQALREGRFK